MFNFKPDIQFINYFRLFNFASLILILISVGFIFYKGLPVPGAPDLSPFNANLSAF